MSPARSGLAAWLALAAAGCQCVTFAPETSFLCTDGACPEGFVCAPDGYCDTLDLDGGGGGGAGGGGGGAGGGAGGGSVALAPCQQAFCWEHPVPWGEAGLNAVATTGQNDAWVVGDNGAIFHWNGAVWQQGTSPFRYDLFDVWVSPEREVWAVGRGGTVVHLEGGRFVNRGRPLADILYGIDGTSTNDFWVVGTNSRIARNQNGTWTDLPSSPAGSGYADVSATDPSRILMVGTALQRWNGSALESVPSPGLGLSAVWADPGGDTFVGGVAGGLYRASGGIPDAGTGWSSLTSGTTADLTALWGLGTGELFIGADDGVYRWASGSSTQLSTLANVTGVRGTDSSNIWATSYDGPVVRRSLVGGQFSDLRQLRSVTTVDLNAVWLNDDGTAFAVGSDHVALRRNGKGDWSTVIVESAQSGNQLWDVWSDRFDRAVAVGSGAVRLAVFDATSGTFKAPAGFTPPQELWAVWGSGDRVWAGGPGSYLVAYDGAAWSQIPAASLPVGFDIEGIWGNSPDNYFLVGSNATIVRWNGAQFTLENSGGTSLLGIGGRWPNDLYAVGQNGVILKRNSSTATWAAETTNVTYTFQAVAVADGVTIAVGAEGELLRRDTLGAWARLPTTMRDGVGLGGLSGVQNRGFLAVGQAATILRYVP